MQIQFCATHKIFRDWNNLPHNVVGIADNAKFHKLVLLRFSRNLLTQDVNNIIHLMNKVMSNE